MSDLGRALLVIGLVLAGLGALLLLAPRVPWLGRLPGDLTWRRGSLTIHAPIATSILLSIVLTIVLTLIARGRR